MEPEQIQDKTIVITGGDVNHIKNVLRMQPGDEIAVSNGVDGKEYRCGIAEFRDDQVICTLRFVKEDGLELPSRVYLSSDWYFSHSKLTTAPPSEMTLLISTLSERV